MTDQCSSLSKQGISSCAVDFMYTQAKVFNVDSDSDQNDDYIEHLVSTVPLFQSSIMSALSIDIPIILPLLAVTYHYC